MKRMFFAAVIVAVAMSATAATRIWKGEGDGESWNDPANWGGTVPDAGDTATINATITFADDIELTDDLTINVGSGKTVTLNGVISGTGNLKKEGGGVLKLLNTANTYDGETILNAGSLYFMTVADIGQPSSLGQPLTADTAKITINGNLYMVSRANAALETDRPVHMIGGTIYVGEIKGTDDNMTLWLKGPYTGSRLYVRARGKLRVNGYLGPSITNLSRTDAGTIELLNPTNSTTTAITLADGTIRVAGLGKPSALGSGSKVSMGQVMYSTVGRLFYNGTTNAVCDRELNFAAYTNSTMTYLNTATSGGRIRNETAGTHVAFTGPITYSRPSLTSYPKATNATVYIWFDGPGDGTVTSDITGRTRLAHEQGGTWSYKGNYTATGIITVSNKCRFELDGTVSEEKDFTLSNKLQVNSGGTLAGTGTVHGASVVYSGGTLAAGATNRCGTLTFGPAQFQLNGGAKLLFKVGAETNDRIVVGGPFVQGTSATVTIQPFGVTTIPDGTYTLMTWSGFPTGTFTLADGAQEGMRLVADATGLKLVVSTAARSITWKGDGTANAWDFTTENWLAGGAPTTFANGDVVTFGDAGSSSPAVAFSTDVSPAAVIVDSASNYVFSSASGLTGATTLRKLGTGVLTLANRNTHTGLTTVEAGALVVSGWLEGSSIVTSYGATFTNTSTSVIAGDAALYLRYGNHVLSGNNTFTGDVTFDSRGDGNAGNCFLYLTGNSALGKAKRLIQFSHSSLLDKNSHVYLNGATIIRGVTLVYGKEGGNRMYMNKQNNSATAGWYGDIVDAETGSGSPGAGYVQADGSGPLNLGDPSGTNEIRTAGGLILRGSGTIHCYSRINRPGRALNRDDGGTAILYNTNNVFASMSIPQGEYRLGAPGVIPTNVTISIGKAATASFARLNLNGFDATIASLNETNVGDQYVAHKRYVTSATPATLTVNCSADCAWGSSHSWIQDRISLVKAGPSTFALNGTNTYTGATLMQAGTLTLNSANALGGTTNVVLTGGTITANASGALNANGTLTVPDPSQGTLSLADGTTQTVEWMIVNDIPMPSGRYTKDGAGTDARLAFLARGTGSGTLLVRKGSGITIIFR